MPEQAGRPPPSPLPGGTGSALGIRSGMTVGILNAPNYFNLDLGRLPPEVTVHRTEAPADLYLIFADRIDEAERGFQRAITYLPPDGAIWVAWPKESSDRAADIDENGLREVLLPTGMVDDKVIAIDETWFALRFVVPEENRADWPPR